MYPTPTGDLTGQGTFPSTDGVPKRDTNGISDSDFSCTDERDKGVLGTKSGNSKGSRASGTKSIVYGDVEAGSLLLILASAT
jgi:hypothetical protein